MSEERKVLFQHRLKMARETLEDASLLHREGRSAWSVINRAYYAMFYAVLALLISIGEGSAKHSGVITLFNRHFIKTGKFPPEMSKWLHRAFDLRQRSDYREMPQIQLEQVEEVFQWAQAFVVQVEAFLAPSLQEEGHHAR